jgi:hypothetical protein
VVDLSTLFSTDSIITLHTMSMSSGSSGHSGSGSGSGSGTGGGSRGGGGGIRGGGVRVRGSSELGTTARESFGDIKASLPPNLRTQIKLLLEGLRRR